MAHMTGIEIKCNKEQKETLIEVLSEGLKIGKLSPKEHVKELLEQQIKWVLSKGNSRG